MTKEDKELLLKDLCARLPYSTIIEASIEDGTSMDVTLQLTHIEELINDTLIIKPYLRPMSSMTEKEKSEFFEISGLKVYDDLFSCKKLAKNKSFIGKLINYLNAHHFDYNGLIENGLALEAPEGMYK